MAKKEKRLPATLRALRHRNYQLFFGGQLISLTGTWMQSVAQSWLIYRMTNSAVLLGFVGCSSQIPVSLLAPIGGAVADKYNRHRILVATQAVSMLLAFALAALTLTGRIEEWHIFVLAAMLGIVNAFNIPAQSAFVVDMVGRDDLVNAIALNSSMVNGARIAGPAVAGILVAAIGEGWCFLVNAVSYVAVIACLLMMSLTPHRRVLLPAGFSMMVEMASSNTLIQAMVPDALRGRVMAVYSMMFMGMAPIGALLAGALAERLGAPETVALGGAVCIVGALAFALRLPVLRDEAREIIIARQM